MLPSTWRGPPPGAIDCVRVKLDRICMDAHSRLLAVLTNEEHDTAARLMHHADRTRALTGRATLRVLLARAAGGDPRALAIEIGNFGKPFLRGGLEFNLSHGGEFILLGFCVGCPVGVDVEPAASGAAWREVVPRLHPTERAAIAAAPDPARLFTQIWTRKEAVAKAAGLGFAVDPRLWAVSAGAPGVVTPPPGIGGEVVWSVFDLDLGCCHAAAAAVQGTAVPRCWTFV
jgi:4'-phosphopantetheinyl transferase